MSQVAPGAPYTLLFEDDPGTGPGLPATIRAIYGGDWRLPAAPARRPYTFTNFVISHDGRISFDEPLRAGSGEVSRSVPHDRWLMALLRTRADAIITGAATLRVSQRHRWTHWSTFPQARELFTALRSAEGRAPLPMLVVLSASGDLPADAPALHVPGQHLLIATTTEGEARARSALGARPMLHYAVTRGSRVDLATLLAELRTNYGITSLLSEGGAHVYGELLARNLIDEIFTTVSPVIVGNRPYPATTRPSLVEGVAFDPDTPPRLRLMSLRRHGDYLFQRAQIVQSDVL